MHLGIVPEQLKMSHASLHVKQSENGASIVLVFISIKIRFSDRENVKDLTARVELQNGTPLTGQVHFRTLSPSSTSNVIFV